MTHPWFRHLIYTTMKNKRDTLAYLEGILSIFINSVLFILKYWAGLVTGSVAIIADSWHTLSDSLTSLIVIVGTKTGAKPGDKQHPFGHGRSELVASLVIGVLLAVVGVKFGIDSVNKLIAHEAATYKPLALIIFIVSVVFKEGLAQFAYWGFRQTGRQSLKADGWHHRSDAIASVIIVIGIVLGPNLWWIDGVMGLSVALLILYATFEIAKDAVNPLIGEEPGEQLLARLNQIAATESPDSTGVHHVHMHRYGDHTELTFHVQLAGNMQLNRAHDVASRIEQTVKTELNMIATVHVEPLP